jgi:hypothetical protein
VTFVSMSLHVLNPETNPFNQHDSKISRYTRSKGLTTGGAVYTG